MSAHPQTAPAQPARASTPPQQISQLQPPGRGILQLLRKHKGTANKPQPNGLEPVSVILGGEDHLLKYGFFLGCRLGFPQQQGEQPHGPLRCQPVCAARQLRANEKGEMVNLPLTEQQQLQQLGLHPRLRSWCIVAMHAGCKCSLSLLLWVLSASTKHTVLDLSLSFIAQTTSHNANNAISGPNIACASCPVSCPTAPLSALLCSSPASICLM